MESCSNFCVFLLPCIFALFRIGRGKQKIATTSFFFQKLLQTLELASKTFWLIVLTLLTQWSEISRPHLGPIQIIELEPRPPLKKVFFLVKSLIEVMITSLIVVLELPNIGHMTTSRTQYKSLIRILLVTSWVEILTLKPLIQNNFDVRRSRIAIFADVIKSLTMFVKTIFKNSKNVKK